MLAHNLSRELQMKAWTSERRTTPKRQALWQFLELGTLRQRLIHRAGPLLRPQGHLTLRMSANPVIKEEVIAYMQAFAPDSVRAAA